MSRGFLLDTHAFLWWMFEAELLSSHSMDVMSDKSIDVFVSAVTAMEVATKYRKGHLPNGIHLVGKFDKVIADEGFSPLAISVAHGERAGLLDSRHKDPWDRLLAAQAEIERLTLVTSDPEMNSFGVKTYW